ncbi:MAG TPA: ParB/RepB/Spo0J family partition protein [Azospirillum sp.]|nr:ParB/RepB/Spo0J family partition protein [Azospirillum sp.]
MSAPAKPRAAFAEGAFAALRAAAGDGQGEALRLLLADIDEDPEQPRTAFDDEGLALLAASICEHGVVQPVVVRPPVDGRYRLAFGARRLRAARLAGLADIPAVIRRGDAGDFAAQVIENQHRAHLSNSDLAAAIARLAADGRTGKQIATICALKDYEVSAFRQAVNFPSELRARIDQGDIRALYDLYRQWRKTPDAVLAALPEADVILTVTEARRIIGGITGAPTGSIVLDQPLPAAGAPDPIRDAVTVPTAGPANNPVDSKVLHRAKPNTPKGHQRSEAGAKPEAVAGPAGASPVQTPVFLVAGADGAVGRLVVDRRAGRPGMALVAYATGVVEVNAADLRIVRVE